MNRNTEFLAVQFEFVQINRIVFVAEETNLFVVCCFRAGLHVVGRPAGLILVVEAWDFRFKLI